MDIIIKAEPFGIVWAQKVKDLVEDRWPGVEVAIVSQQRAGLSMSSSVPPITACLLEP